MTTSDANKPPHPRTSPCRKMLVIVHRCSSFVESSDRAKKTDPLDGSGIMDVDVCGGKGPIITSPSPALFNSLSALNSSTGRCPSTSNSNGNGGTGNAYTLARLTGNPRSQNINQCERSALLNSTFFLVAALALLARNKQTDQHKL